MSDITLVRETFRLENLHCPSCVARIEQAVGRLEGVHASRVAFGAGQLAVTYDPARTTSQAVAAAVGRLGYPAHSLGARPVAGERGEPRAR